MCFIDGNHRQEPTERYFHQLLPKLNNNSVLIFDDIHWSKEMEEAWATIKEHEAVRCTSDLFFIGIVFFRQEFKEKQHFRVRF
jgi:predicted O-methyltransferase YrrM